MSLAGRPCLRRVRLPVPRTTARGWTSAAVSNRPRLSRGPRVRAWLRHLSRRARYGGASADCTHARVAPRPRFSKPAPSCSAIAPSWSGRPGLHRRPPRPKRGALLAAPHPDLESPAGTAPALLALQASASLSGSGNKGKMKSESRKLKTGQGAPFRFHLSAFCFPCVGCRTGTAPATACFTGRRLASRLPTPRWLASQDLNLDRRFQRPPCSRYTTRHCWRRRLGSNQRPGR